MSRTKTPQDKAIDQLTEGIGHLEDAIRALEPLTSTVPVGSLISHLRTTRNRLATARGCIERQKEIHQAGEGAKGGRDHDEK